MRVQTAISNITPAIPLFTKDSRVPFIRAIDHRVDAKTRPITLMLTRVRGYYQLMYRYYA